MSKLGIHVFHEKNVKKNVNRDMIQHFRVLSEKYINLMDKRRPIVPRLYLSKSGWASTTAGCPETSIGLNPALPRDTRV